MDREAWHAAVHGATKSQTRLSNWTELTDEGKWLFVPDLSPVPLLKDDNFSHFSCFLTLKTSNIIHFSGLMNCGHCQLSLLCKTSWVYFFFFFYIIPVFQYFSQIFIVAFFSFLFSVSFGTLKICNLYHCFFFFTVFLNVLCVQQSSYTATLPPCFMSQVSSCNF